MHWLDEVNTTKVGFFYCKVELMSLFSMGKLERDNIVCIPTLSIQKTQGEQCSGQELKKATKEKIPTW